MNGPDVAVVILNYNGKYFLEKLLNNIISCSAPHQVYVADNQSTDDSVSFLRQNFPSVIIIENNGNHGYAKGYNDALKNVSAEYYVLLNSDVEVTPGWIEPVIDLMKSDKSIAACQPKLLDFKHRELFEYAGASGGYIDNYCYPFCRGRLFSTIETDVHQYDNPAEVFWATGAALFVKSELFWKVGGFDDDYFAHMEEIDLCWRLKNVGYKIYVQPKSVVYHVGGGTLNKFSSKKTFLNFRNNLTTLAKNHKGSTLPFKIVYRMILDGVAAFRFLSAGTPSHFFAVIRAHFSFYGRIPDIIAKRNAMKKIPGFHFNRSLIYKGNVVYEYFLGKAKKFTELKKGFF